MVIPEVSEKQKSKRTVEKQGSPIFAYIDMGTNSFHMIVCHAVPEHDHFEVISRVKHTVPFFRRCLTAHYIDEHAQQSAMRILQDMCKKARQNGATSIMAVATSAVRESRNGQEFLNHVNSALGIDAKMISGREEARLIYLGVLWNMPELSKSFGIIDIGGGSTEIIAGDRVAMSFAESYKLGAARLTEQFFPKNSYSKQSIARLHNLVHGVIQPAAAHIFSSGQFSPLIGTSGTIQALARLDQEMLGKSGSGKDKKDLQDWKLSRKRLAEYVSQMEEESLAGKKLSGISSDRSHTILAGAIVLLETMKALSFDEITVCTAALREGAVIDRLLQTGWLTCDLDHHITRRQDSVHYLLHKYQASVDHATHVALLSQEIFEQTQGYLHNYSKPEEHLLWSAAMLHDVGTFIGRKGHHKHSYYLIKNAGLFGHSEQEIEIIAQIARYHRGIVPKESHPEFHLLPAEKRKLVEDLASILRLAEALDRSHRQLIDKIELEFPREGKSKSRQISLFLSSKKKSALEAELWAVNEKKYMFEEQFGVKLSPSC
jgi:exopolyphosphatase/guanosine-5'-triphosphate,3'-diphosphate pyrophosphatase